MDLIPYLSAVILVSTVATILLAVVSYTAFKLRDKRRPKADLSDEPSFFRRYRRDPSSSVTDAADSPPADEAFPEDETPA